MSSLNSDDQDAQDMVRLAGGQDFALNQLMARHGEKLYRYLLRSLQDDADAADLAQETFVRVYQNRARYNPSQKFSTWLYAIASNLVRDRYRWRSRHQSLSLDAEHPHLALPIKDAMSAGDPAPDQDLQARERSGAVRQAIAGLPQELRQPLILSLYEELPHAEIAGILGCSAKAVETRIYRARQQLRSTLAQLVAG
jgi:RNA polymerase sigma-70 factor (ECF subfamily)